MGCFDNDSHFLNSYQLASIPKVSAFTTKRILQLLSSLHTEGKGGENLATS